MIDAERLRATEELFSNPAFEEAYQKCRSALIEASLQCEPKDDAGRYRYATAIKGLDWVMGFLKATMTAGMVDKAEAESLASLPTPWWSLPGTERPHPKF